MPSRGSARDTRRCRIALPHRPCRPVAAYQLQVATRPHPSYNGNSPAQSLNTESPPMKRLLIYALLLSCLTTAAVGQKPQSHPRAGSPSFNTITTDRLMSHIKALSSDEYEGRSPGTHGEDLSINYIANQFKQAGPAPGKTAGRSFQRGAIARI